ncbi:MAG: phosphotriesterase [Isosphaeraceae bacterium]
MNRRDALRSSLAAGVCGLFPMDRSRAEPRRAVPLPADGTGKIWTVRGPIEPKDLGICLPHEHVMVDFIGADRVSTDRYDVNAVTRVVFPFLTQLKDLGVKSLAECTPAYLGRDVRLLASLSDATGLQILTNTGYYAANGGKHLPEHAKRETADQLAERWLVEWKEGIDGSGIRPGFMKIGVGSGPLTPVERNLVRAAAKVHLGTGLTIAAHTGGGRAAIEQLDLLQQEGVDASAFIWVHAQTERDAGRHNEAAARGAFVEFDGLASEANVIKYHVGLVNAMRRRGHFDHLLLSHDAGWFHVGEPNGGEFRSFEPLIQDFLPALRAEGYEDEDVNILVVDNPRNALTLRVRATR